MVSSATNLMRRIKTSIQFQMIISCLKRKEMLTKRTNLLETSTKQDQIQMVATKMTKAIKKVKEKKANQIMRSHDTEERVASLPRRVTLLVQPVYSSQLQREF